MPANSEAAGAVEAAVTLPVDLHARPAGRVVRAAAGGSATVEIRYADRSANARSILAVLVLGAPSGATVVVRATGPDAPAAVRAVADALTAADPEQG
jgi:phosphotransferase system HPr (HPr) family protein